MVGAGAVATAAAYWLVQWGNLSSWTTIDHDTVALHNTNRSLLFFPDDAGWPDGTPQAKVYLYRTQFFGHRLTLRRPE